MFDELACGEEKTKSIIFYSKVTTYRVPPRWDSQLSDWEASTMHTTTS